MFDPPVFPTFHFLLTPVDKHHPLLGIMKVWVCRLRLLVRKDSELPPKIFECVTRRAVDDIYRGDRKHARLDVSPQGILLKIWGLPIAHVIQHDFLANMRSIVNTRNANLSIIFVILHPVLLEAVELGCPAGLSTGCSESYEQRTKHTFGSIQCAIRNLGSNVCDRN